MCDSDASRYLEMQNFRNISVTLLALSQVSTRDIWFMLHLRVREVMQIDGFSYG